MNEAVIEHLKTRWPDASRVASCSACALIGKEYSFDFYSTVSGYFEGTLGAPTRDDIEPPTFAIAKFGSRYIRECRACGALFEQDSELLTAADNLFASEYVIVRRISPATAIALLSGEP